LQKHLPGRYFPNRLRTQTKIKNYFYGNIRYLLKIIVKYFFKKSTGFINDIKTETLLDMYEAKNGIFSSIQLSMTISSSTKPSKDLDTGLKKSSVKKLLDKTRKIFTILPKNSSPAKRKKLSPIPQKKN
jgi:hypothetical protein